MVIAVCVSVLLAEFVNCFCKHILLSTDFVCILFNMQDSQEDQPLADETFLSKIKVYLSIYLIGEQQSKRTQSELKRTQSGSSS